MRGQWQRISGNAGGFGPGGCKREAMGAADDTRQPPESVRHDAEIGTGRCGLGIERLVVVAAPRGYDQGAIRAQRVAQGSDQSLGSTVHRTDRPVGCVDQEHSSLSNAQRTKLVGERRTIHH
jgi:hypothetical protein